MIVLGDTGAVYALLDRSDAWHERVLTWWRGARQEVLLPAPVLPEIAYLLQRRIGPHAEAAFVRALDQGQFEWLGLEPRDVSRAAQLAATYQSLPLGFVDAAIVAMAERLNVRTVLTTDRKHFGPIRPAHTQALLLAP